MKRCIFVGPSLHGVAARPSGIEFRPPARAGDIADAVQEGFEWIGLIDGYFGFCASVWHKEILYALSTGCHVCGAASMGALRAAECRSFGMQPVGSIAMRYANGMLNDDADVALLHGPEGMDYLPLTEALVEVNATLDAMVVACVVTIEERELLGIAARRLHFEVRTVEAFVVDAVPLQDRSREIMGLFEHHRVRQKQVDAMLLVDVMNSTLPRAIAPIAPWKISKSDSLLKLLGHDRRRK